MITAQLNFFGVFRDVVPESRVALTLPAEFGWPELVNALAERFGDAIRRRFVNRLGYVHTYVKIFVAGEETRGTPDERFGPFPDGSTEIEIYILPMVEGG